MMKVESERKRNEVKVSLYERSAKDKASFLEFPSKLGTFDVQHIVCTSAVRFVYE